MTPAGCERDEGTDEGERTTMTTMSLGKGVILDRDALRRMAVAETDEGRREHGRTVEYGVPVLAPFDAVSVRDGIVRGIRRVVHDSGFGKVVVGISGGKDSSVTAALCVRALGAGNVTGVLMPDGEQADIADSREVTDALGIRHMTVNIGEIHDALLRAIPSGMLAGADGDGMSEADINVIPRLRMTVLRYVCQSTGALLMGTGNLSEMVVGYFTKDGDSSCDVAVLANLTSIEVVEVGKTLEEIPRRLVEKTPVDGLSGKTDEEKLGVSYVDIHNWIRMGTSGSSDVDATLVALRSRTRHKRVPAPKAYEDWLSNLA